MAGSRAFLVAVCAVVHVALADLPVHCLRHEVVGHWEFTLGPQSAKRSSCGHRSPDKAEAQPDLSFIARQGTTTTRRFSLRDPNIVTAEDGGTGTWTMIYDEAFEVVAGGYTFLAFSRFEFVHDKLKGKTNVSHCDQTEVGWYHDHERGHWGCYVARKVLSPARNQSFLQKEPTRAVSATAAGLYHAWVPKSRGYDKPADDEWHEAMTRALTFLQLGWSAGPPAGRFMGKTPREVNQLVGIRRSVPQTPRSLPEPTSFLGVSARTRRSSHPDALDWRKRDGKNWLEPVVTQGDCGSCYTIATIHMLTARNRIRKKDPGAERFSVMFPLYCSEYNQGCDGGYGFLQTKWSEDVGLVPERCAPFTNKTTSCKISKQCELGSIRYRATNHRYIGGYYGATREEAMKKELITRGPFVASFEPTEDFMYYQSGVYSSGRNFHREWEQVDHAVLLVGYGKEKRRRYWTLQNSWGDDWGEGGFFRIERGQDACGVESIAVAADVVEEPSNQVLDSFIASL